MPRAVVFRGTRELQKAEVQAQLGLNPAVGGGGGARTHGVSGSAPRAGGAGGIGRYLLPVGEHDFALESAIEDLQVQSASLTPRRVPQGPLSMQAILDTKLPVPYASLRGSSCSAYSTYSDPSMQACVALSSTQYLAM